MPARDGAALPTCYPVERPRRRCLDKSLSLAILPPGGVDLDDSRWWRDQGPGKVAFQQVSAGRGECVA